MKTLLLLLSFLFCITLSAQKGKPSQSIWHEEEDGDKKPSPDKYFCLKKEKACYFISNDFANIYIDMKFTDVLVQNRILKQGMTIWINMDDKQAKKLGVRFPIGSLNPVGRNKPKLPDDNINTEASLMGPLSVANMIELVGFISEEERHFSAENADTFRGSVTYEKGTMYYKLVMPIVKLPLRNSKDRKSAMPFTLGVEYGLMTVNPEITPVLFWIKNIKLATSK
jgi:hypothetical protein